MLAAGKVEISNGATVEFRMLSAKSLRKAAQARSSQAAQSAKDWGAELVQVFQKADTPEGKAERERKAASPEARYDRYDRGLVLLQGITAWDLPEKLSTDPEDQLSEHDADKVFRAIVDLSVPTQEQAEAAVKNA